MTTSKVTIESELNRRMDLVNNPKFRSICAKAAKKMGVTAKEWNENRSGILMMMANKVCKMENKLS